MVNLLYAARGLWRMAVNFIREAVRSSLLAVMHMVSCNGSQSKSPGLAISAIFGSD